MKRQFIIGQDSFGPGGSNLPSILMVLQSPDIEGLGLTVPTGDGWMKENVAHALRLLELIGRTDAPGATGALLNSAEGARRWETLHGKPPTRAHGWSRGPTPTPCTARATTPPTSSAPSTGQNWRRCSSS